VRYPGPQLRLLILLALTLLAGLGVREWRAGFPDAAERLERFDREDGAAILPEPVPARPAPLAPATPRTGVATRPGAPERIRPGEVARGGAAPPAGGPAMPWAQSRRTDGGRPGAVGTSPPAEPLDVNRADAPALARLPGVSPSLAQRIVEERERRGRFESPEALRYVLGMGPKKLAAIRPFITVRD
jgi:competence ComEA-like helix-hairpin-helix protein